MFFSCSLGHWPTRSSHCTGDDDIAGAAGGVSADTVCGAARLCPAAPFGTPADRPLDMTVGGARVTMSKALRAATLAALLACASRETACLICGAAGGGASYHRGSLEMIGAPRDEL